MYYLSVVIGCSVSYLSVIIGRGDILSECSYGMVMYYLSVVVGCGDIFSECSCRV